jgi:hypothetical protein
MLTRNRQLGHGKPHLSIIPASPIIPARFQLSSRAPLVIQRKRETNPPRKKRSPLTYVIFVPPWFVEIESIARRKRIVNKLCQFCVTHS